MKVLLISNVSPLDHRNLDTLFKDAPVGIDDSTMTRKEKQKQQLTNMLLISCSV